MRRGYIQTILGILPTGDNYSIYVIKQNAQIQRLIALIIAGKLTNGNSLTE
jgi:hypothetical protein